jgi:beta-galactosidase
VRRQNYWNERNFNKETRKAGISDSSSSWFPYDWWRGWGWYRKHFSIGRELAGRKVFIEFDGVQKYCQVFVNGKLAGDHKGGYSGFYFDR